MDGVSDSEEPPDLIDTGHDDPGLAMDPMHKVPITIITGKRHGFILGSQPLTRSRLSWSGQDYIAELHTYCRAWKEDCSHPERLVVPLIACSDLASVHRLA